MRISFQTRVLLPVLCIMGLLALVPLGMLSHTMSTQLELTAAQTLAANDAVFQNLQSIRSRNLLLRFQSVPKEPRFKAVLQLSDPGTLRFLFTELCEEMGSGTVLLLDAESRVSASASLDPRFVAAELPAAAGGLVERALAGEPGASIGAINGHLFDLVAIPVVRSSGAAGVVVFAIAVGESAAREFTQLTRSHVVLLSGESVAVATIGPAHGGGPGEPAELHTLLSSKASSGRVLLKGEHFMYMAGRLTREEGAARARYILLSSYEAPLQALRSVERSFLWAQLIGILGGGIFVCVAVRRVTRPLRDLRDTAEAVGRGDFSRSLEVTSNDECGDLAEGFNRMMRNLEASRSELQQAVETLRSTQVQLVQSEKMRAIGTLAGGIAHDFNNILGAILGFCELALEDVDPATRTARNLRQVHKAGQRARELVRQILTFGRQSEPQRSSVKLSAMIDEVLKLLRASIPASVELVTRLETDADTVVADPTQLHQVLMNLGTNASHAMRATGGRFTVSVAGCVVPAGGLAELPSLPPGTYVRLTAEDTGHGMDRSTLERVFEPFFTSKPVGEGTGLGLSVVHGIIKNHGGEITVRSVVGQGTAFDIYLPRAEAAGSAAPAPEALNAPGSGTLMVVDDEEALVGMMEQKLGRLGYRVVPFQSSLEALRELRADPTRYAALITDHHMPHLTGRDLAAEAERLAPGIPVFLCSGAAEAPRSGETLPANVREWVLKPIDFPRFANTLRQALESAPAQPHHQP